MKSTQDVRIIRARTTVAMAAKLGRAGKARREARLLAELSDARRLHKISTELIQEEQPEALYQQIVEAVAQVMRSDAATIQEYVVQHRELRLLAHLGLHPASVAHWRNVRAGATCACGTALSSGCRTMVEDIENCQFMAGTPDLAEYRRSRLRTVQATPLISRGGQVIGMMSTYWRERHVPSEADLSLLDILSRQAADLIERAQVHQALRASEERWRRVFDTSGVGILFFDGSGTLVDANDAFLQATGYSRSQVGRRELSWRSMTPPEWLEDTERQFARLAATGRIGPYEKEYFRCDGSRAWMMFTGRSLADGSVVEYCIDMTGRKRAEEALRESEERFRQFAEASTDVLWIADARERRLEYLSPAYEAVWGEPPDRVMADVGRWEELLYPEDRERASQDRNHLLSKGRFTHEYRIVRSSDRAIRWIRDTGFAIRDEKGAVVRLAGIAQDVTAEKTYEDALRGAKREAERANQAKSEFLAKMSHEIRTPLNGIIGMADLALLYVDNPKVREYLELAKTAAWQLTGLIGDILDIARIEAGRVQIEKAPFRLREELEASLGPLRTLADAGGLRLTLRVNAGVPDEMVGDAARLRQVITNLVGNAIKFTAKGSVALNVRKRGDLIFEVRDTGSGIAEDQLGQIFDSFVQVGHPAHSNLGGTGLGLAISKQLVELMGGRIWVESTVGKGSRFFFSLPLDTPQPGNEARRAVSA